MEVGPVCDEQKRALVDALLARLSPRAQAVLRLRYGLSDDDERTLTIGEVARQLGTTRHSVRITEQDAMQRLRALAAGQASIVVRGGKPCISLSGIYKPAISPQRQAMLMRGYTRLQAQGVTITACLLAQVIGIPRNLAGAFLQTQCKETAKLRSQPARTQRLETAYSQLQTT